MISIKDSLSSNRDDWAKLNKSYSFDSVLHESRSDTRVSKGLSFDLNPSLIELEPRLPGSSGVQIPSGPINNVTTRDAETRSTVAFEQESQLMNVQTMITSP